MGLYIAVALHDTGNGQLGMPFFASRDVARAVEAARKAEKLGFTFSHWSSGVTIYSLAPDRPYREIDFWFVSDPPSDFPAICHFFKENGKWEEEWHNEMMEDRFSNEPSARKKRRAQERHRREKTAEKIREKIALGE